MSTIEEAVVALREGAVVGIPTDTVYGLAVSPYDRDAVGRLFAMKGRDDAKPIAVLVASAEQAREVASLSPVAMSLAAEHWPGALTIIAPTLGRMAEGVGQDGTVGVRMPDHPMALELLAASGPLAVTSANRSGKPECLDDECAVRVFGDEVRVYLPGRGSRGLSSTVVDVTTTSVAVLRDGPVDVGGPSRRTAASG